MKKKKERGILTNIKSTYKYAKSGKKYLYLFFVANILLTIISVIAPIFVAKRLIYVTSGTFEKLLGVVVLIFWIEILRNFTRYFYKYSYNKFYYNVRRDLQLNLTRETLRITQEDLDNNSSGVFIERINTDTDNLADIFTELIDYITSIIGNLGVLVSVYIINVYVGIAYTIYIFGLIFVHKITSDINNENRKQWKKSREKTGGFISEIIRGAKDVKILDAEESFLHKADEYMKETNEVSYKYQMIRSRNNLIAGSINDVGDLSISVLYYFLLITNLISIEMIIVLYNYHNRLTWTSGWIEQVFEIVKKYNLASNRIFGIIEGNEFKKEIFGTEKLENFEGDIEFKNVNFSYKKRMPVLKNMNFKIESNSTVGFVGSSGSGKTTIFNLISALNKPDSGEITFDGKNINNLDKSSIRGNLSVISQNAYIFNMSILDNLKVIKMDATTKEIKEACKMACIDEFINSLPDKYNTIVGEGGVTLSGGQKQRLAIARALLLKTEILLFDEATSALDNETQTKIQEAIANLKGEYTILIIAHRLSTVIDSDKILVIDDGKVVGEGKHELLLKECETYKKLYQKELEETKE